MNTLHKIALSVLLATAASTAAVGQTQTQPKQTDPAAASSPHQRDATSTNATEAPATSGAEPANASSPHQQHATEASKDKNSQAMKDCVKNQQSRDSSLSKDDAKKACTQQMKNSSSSQSE